MKKGSNTVIKIEKNILIPGLDMSQRKHATGSKYPFSTLKVDESFAITFKTNAEAKKLVKNLVSSKYRVIDKSENKGKEFTIRTLHKSKEVRIWRIK